MKNKLVYLLLTLVLMALSAGIAGKCGVVYFDTHTGFDLGVFIVSIAVFLISATEFFSRGIELSEALDKIDKEKQQKETQDLTRGDTKTETTSKDVYTFTELDRCVYDTNESVRPQKYMFSDDYMNRLLKRKYVKSIIDVIGSNPNYTTREINKALHTTSKETQPVIDKLVAAYDFIDCKSDGKNKHYTLTEKGMELYRFMHDPDVTVIK